MDDARKPRYPASPAPHAHAPATTSPTPLPDASPSPPASPAASILPATRLSTLFPGGSAMAEALDHVDWAHSSLGPVHSWPQSLRTALSICLASRFPILIWWGPDLVMLYNDAYRVILGAKHPASLGAPGRQVWPEIWHIIGPMLESVLRDGQATWSDDQFLPLERNGYAEECYFTFSYSPIQDESGGVGGVFCAVTETTGSVLAQRRMRVARDVAAAIVDARNAEEVCGRAIDALAADTADVPYAGLYLLSARDSRAYLAASSDNGLVRSSPLSEGGARLPATIDLAAGTGSPRRTRQARLPQPLAQAVARVARSGQREEVRSHAARAGADTRTSGSSQEGQGSETALVLPVYEPGASQPSAVLVAGVSAMRELDDEYLTFYDLLVSHLSAGLASARAYEEERRRAEALAEIDRTKTAFFSNVSHEFRTPLTLMLGPLEDLLVTSPNLTADDRARIELVHRNSLRLLKLVNSLLDFARIEAGRVQASYVPTDVASATADLASSFRSLVERAGLRFVVDCPPLTALREPVYIDRGHWEKIVFNLLSNAFKFTFAGEIEVRLRAEDGGQRVVLTVRDTGTGIAPDDLPRIFERFHRVQGARARSFEGSGIGLALVQELVALHGGTVLVESREGQGTTFTVSLPTGSAHLPAAQVRAHADARATDAATLGAAPYVEEARRWLPTAGGAPVQSEDDVWLREDGLAAPAAPRVPTTRADDRRARVLVADDNADLREYVQRLLGEHYDVEVVPDGAAALAAVRQRMPDLVLSDVMMPEMDGFTLLRALRADPSTAAVPVILLSARAGEEATLGGLEAGADDYLIKPFSARELLARVTAHLEVARLRQEALRQARDFATVFEAIADGVVVYGSAGELRMMNAAYRKLVALEDEMLDDAFDVRAAAILPRDPATGLPLPPEDYPGRRILRGETLSSAGSVDVLIRAHDGRDVLLNCAGAPLRDARGHVSGAVMVIRDVGERRTLEREVAEHAAQLVTLVQTMPDAAVLFDRAGDIQLANAAFRQLFGLDEHAEFFSRSVEDRRRILGMRDLEGNPLSSDLSPFERVVRRGQTLVGDSAVEVLALRGDGQEIEVEIVGTPVRGATGELLGGVLLYRDVTARRRLERRTHDALDALLATARELVDTEVAPDRYEGVRGVATRLAGLARQVLGCEVVSLAGVDGKTGRFVPLATVGRTPKNERAWYASGGTTGPAQYYGEEKLAALSGGETIIMDVSAAAERSLPLYGTRAAAIAPLTAGGRLEGVLSAAYTSEAHGYTAEELDLAAGFAQMAHLVLQRERLLGERESARSNALALVEATRRMDEFLGIASHELRTPLTSVTANIQLATRQLKSLSAQAQSQIQTTTTEATAAGDATTAARTHDLRNRLERAQLLLERTERQAVRMDRLVGDLLDVARIQAGKLEFRMEPCDLLPIIREAVQEQGAAWSARTITLDLPDRATIPVVADTDRIGQVVTNYLTNALKYSSTESAVRVRVRVQGAQAHIAVSDDGPGLTPEQQEHLFERFYRVPGIQRQSGSGVGLGLGLHICKTIVERHGGSIGLESALGRGSTFWFTVPLAG